MAVNFRPLPGELITISYPLDEMQAYDSLPIELRQAVARANVKLHVSTVVRALNNAGAVTEASPGAATDKGWFGGSDHRCYSRRNLNNVIETQLDPAICIVALWRRR